MSDFPRLIEHAFPLEATSIDSVHEKNVRHGHISTLHIWPARRPLAACRAALIATLLPDPGTAEGRRELCEKIAGKVVKKIERKKMPNGQIVERVKKETEGGILHWGRETENAETLQWFRDEIRKAYGGRAPKVLDPFAGGGAIPLEAMRLGCEATAVDINPVAWFILKCTLEYPQKLAGQTRQLPDFILKNDEFMTEFFKKAKGYSKTEIRAALTKLHERLKKKKKWNDTSQPQQTFGFVNDGAEDEGELQADLAWHVRAWGTWVLERARRDLAKYYPTYADFEPLKKDSIPYEPQPMRLLKLKSDGAPDVEALNGEFSEDYLSNKGNPRWVAKPAVAYLWARTIKCGSCRAQIPLLKTLWLCKKPNKRVLLTVTPKKDQSGVSFSITRKVEVNGGNSAQRREHDKRLSSGTMSRSGAKCVCCSRIMTMEDIRLEGKANKLGVVLTAIAIESPTGKEYRTPTVEDLQAVEVDDSDVKNAFAATEFGVPMEPMPTSDSLGMRVPLYGFDNWGKLFGARQITSLGTFAKHIGQLPVELAKSGYMPHEIEAINAYLSVVLDRTANYMSSICIWDSGAEEVKQTFLRFALPMTWDFAEANPLANADRYFIGGLSKVGRVLDELLPSALNSPEPSVVNQSAIAQRLGGFDVIVTDPPYYDAIPYSDLMDFFYVWLRRSYVNADGSCRINFTKESAPKWDHEANDGELIDESSRHGNSKSESTRVYEDGMARAFTACSSSLSENGRLVIVFANKQPAAWETLVTALIRSGFVVDGSWPIATEMRGVIRNLARASLASSVWLVCKKRPPTAKPGWDNKVLEEMRTKIATQLREFWDAGIRGPDFVWAATGPAMEAYSKHPVVRKALVDGEVMSVGEFLTHVRRMVVDYVVGQVLTGAKEKETVAADRLDEVTAYYLLHRYDFQMDEAPVGACILYATACGLTDTELERTWDILVRGNASFQDDEEEADSDDADESIDEDSDPDSSGSGGKVKLKDWERRTHRSMGIEAPEGRPVPLVDRIHRVMHLWKSGDVQKVDEYLDEHGLRRNELFKRVVQSLIELSSNGERSLLESISNHIGAKGAIADRGPLLAFEFEEDE